MAVVNVKNDVAGSEIGVEFQIRRGSSAAHDECQRISWLLEGTAAHPSYARCLIRKLYSSLITVSVQRRFSTLYNTLSVDYGEEIHSFSNFARKIIREMAKIWLRSKSS